jgi:hypothetical protein
MPLVAVIIGWSTLAAGAALLDRPHACLAALAVVATAAGVAPAGLLLAAGAVLAAALDSPIAVLCGLPGAVLLADTLAAQPLSWRVAISGLGLAAAGIAVGLRMRGGIRVDGGRPVAVALAAWLVFAPGTWAFTGAEGLDGYDTGALRALATGALVALVVLYRRGADVTWQAQSAEEGLDSVLPLPVVSSVIAVAATLASVGWLVLSVVQLH